MKLQTTVTFFDQVIFILYN